MKMVLKMLPAEKDVELESEKFWAKLDLANGKLGFLPSELAIDDNDKVFFICPRPIQKSFLRLFPSRPLNEGTFVSLAFQNNDCFELWSGEIKKFIEQNEDGLDCYELDSIKQEMSQSEREKERFCVSIPLKLKIKHKTFHFTGCELSEKGICLWFPNSLKNRIKNGEQYTLTFEPSEVESFSFIVENIRPNLEDSFSKGFTAGFTFIDLNPDGVSALRIKQLIMARGHLGFESLELEPKHYLEGFWKGESFEV